jgi:hypothetical protein
MQKFNNFKNKQTCSVRIAILALCDTKKHTSKFRVTIPLNDSIKMARASGPQSLWDNVLLIFYSILNYLTAHKFFWKWNLLRKLTFIWKTSLLCWPCLEILTFSPNNSTLDFILWNFSIQCKNFVKCKL